MELDFNTYYQSIGLLANGLKITGLITASGIATGLFLGTFLAIARNSKNKITSNIAKGYINLFRAVPLLVVLSSLYLIGMSVLKAKGIYTDIAMPATLIGFALFEAAYFAEIIRSGMNAIAAGQVEAAKALGFSTFQTYSLVIIPQAFKNAFQSITTQSVAIFHDSTLCYVVGLSDLFTTFMHLGERDGTVETAIVLAASFYLVACVAIRQAAKRITTGEIR